ncbi:magnesium transporter [Tissierella praeacuta DSM 18095]|uniref:Magnesium transporter MgtE n=1 Tax=Tissierella praeacuta DSM 18095 TaxID=1123404 RepID=A0A1M4XT46_9FIRM|nr:magnesium transporter [Tissierella praeacuta]TCU79208.1 magnesium transporter [Tissierella praeacuta]SHE96422.1 magnesium transporter [Tissierella praeacuta DSM 18095]SUO99168.1 Magnesium transporter mgtE [Tissierella praeacuta]
MDERKLLELIQQKKYIEIKKELSEMNEVDVAELLDPLDAHMTLLIFRMLPKDLAVEVFAHFSTEQQLGIINSVTDKELEYIMDELFFDDMIDLIEEMPANIVKKVLKATKEDERKLINQFLKYPADSAGSIMTIEYVDLRKGITVKEALEHIKETGLNKETVYTCYVTDGKRTLEGFVSLRTLVTSDEELLIDDIMEDEVIRVNTHDDQESVANVFRKYGFLALPVVDNENRLTGIITVDDIMDIMEQEATEDFQIMAAMSPSEDAYLNTGVFALARHRLPWLLILMVSATFTGRIMGKFENVLASVVILSTFIPMLMDTGGNSGSQSSTLIIRGLATGEITTHDWLKVLWKELRISLIVGIVLSAINFVRLIVIEKIELSIAITVSLTLIVTVMTSKVVGGTLPLVAKKLKLDPAIMAGPLITTIVDALSLIVYFGIATTLLGL